MELNIREDHGVQIIKIIGSIDGKTAPDAQEKIMKTMETHKKIILDMSEVDFLSSAGLRMLLLAYREIKEKQGELVLVGVIEEVQNVMEMTGFKKYFTLCDSMAEADKL